MLWVERRVEGDRLQRIRLDAAPWSAEKFARKGIKHAIWIALSFWTGFTFVGYFTPIHTLWHSAWSLALGPWETFWVLFYGLTTYGNAGFLREQVCKYMCPYARFQSAMFDRDTLIITYDTGRGEPRGARSRNVDPRAAGLGDCVDCNICVQVCPTAIDIRNGLQYDCIGCAACIDSCNQVMAKMGYPAGLIRYSTQNALAQGLDSKAMWRRVWRMRTLVYSGVLLAIMAATFGSLAWRVPLKVDVIRDRGALARETEPGVIENVYRLQIMNIDETPHRYHVGVNGLTGLSVVGIDQPIVVAGESTAMAPVRLRAAAEAGTPGSHPIEFAVQAEDRPQIVVREASRFLFPR
jgi:cytochrome c oxidase accessory protein FixG